MHALLESKEESAKLGIQTLLRACVTCHSSILKEKVKQNKEKTHHKYKSIYDHDDAQLYFANSFKYSFASRKNQVITIVCQGKVEKYEELVIINFELKGSPMTIQVLRTYGS